MKPSHRVAKQVAAQVSIPLGCAVATYLAAEPALRDYRVEGAVELVAAAASLSTIITFVAARLWRRPPAVSYALSAAGLVGLVLVGAGLHASEIARNFAQGPSRLLTETLPLSGSRPLLVDLVALTWLCGSATTELLTRAPRLLDRPTNLGLAVPVGVYLLSYATSTSAPGSDRLAGPLLLLTLAGLAVVRQVADVDATPVVAAPEAGLDGARPTRFRAPMAGALAAVAVTLAASVGVAAIPAVSEKPVSLHRVAPTAAKLVLDPVDTLAEFRDVNTKSPARQVMDIDLNEPSSGYLAMAVLDAYDGDLWRFNATFEPTGGRIRAVASSPGGAVSSSTVMQRIRVVSPLPVPLLPVLDRPVLVEGLTALADQATGMMLPAGATSPPLSYVAVSSAPADTLSAIPSADGVGQAGSVAASDLQLPPDASTAMADTLRFLSILTGQRPAPTVAFLQDVLASLHARERRVDPALAVAPTKPQAGLSPARKKRASGRPAATTTTTLAPVTASDTGGTSLSEVINAVTVDRAATPEQFATLFAMTARDLGVPARVATGFRVGASSASPVIGAGSYNVTNRQAWTWVEVAIAGLGWVVADPTPDARTGVATPPPEQAETVGSTVPPRQANAVPRAEVAGGHPLARPATVTIERRGRLPVWLAVLSGLAGLLVLAALVGPGQAAARRTWRRRTRRVGDPGEVAVGAWLELLDGLGRAGMTTAEGSTNSEVAAATAEHFSPELAAPVEQVGALADRALFSSRDPVDPSSAVESWAVQRSVRRTVTKSLDRRQRAMSLLLVGTGPRRPSSVSGR